MKKTTIPMAIPALAPVESPLELAGLASLGEVGVGPAVEEVWEALLVERVWIILGSAISPSTNQPPAVELGHAGGVKVGEYAELATPVGGKVAHWLCRLV